MYRFRSIEKLFGFKELENQEIYFSDINDLNDPMEGFRQVYWRGDSIVWKNFLKHYLLCLEHICVRNYLSQKDETFTKEDIPVFKDEKELPTKKYKRTFQKICDRFFGNEIINEYIEVLISTKINRDELFVYLKPLHLLALNVITEIHIEQGLQPPSAQIPPDVTNQLTRIVEVLKQFNMEREDTTEQEKLEILFEFQKEFIQDIDLKQAYNLNDSPKKQRKWFTISKFTDAYLNQIMKLTYPKFYVASFMENCTNTVAWGHYANGHKGVCLKFKTEERNGLPSIDLKCIVGRGSKPIYDYRPFLFRKIEYVNQFPSINFFNSLGRLNVNQLISQWYTNQNGEKSQCAMHLENKNNKQEWREQYWANYKKSIFMKLKDWEYEKEYRLSLSSSLNLYNEKKARKLKYKFEDLEAIIFGLKTSMENKIKIIKIIESKCKANNRDDFDFYQANYSSSKGSMKISKIHSVNL